MLLRLPSSTVFRTRSNTAETHLVGVLELEAGDHLTLQLAVGHRLGQDRLAELWDVGFTGLPQHRVQPVVCTHKHAKTHTH